MHARTQALFDQLNASGLLPAPLSFKAALQLLKDATRPSKLKPAIQATIAAANLNGVLLAAGLGLARWF